MPEQKHHQESDPTTYPDDTLEHTVLTLLLLLILIATTALSIAILGATS